MEGQIAEQAEELAMHHRNETLRRGGSVDEAYGRSPAPTGKATDLWDQNEPAIADNRPIEKAANAVHTLADLEGQVIILTVNFPWKGHIEVAGRVRVFPEVAWVGDLCLDKRVVVEKDGPDGKDSWKIYSMSLEELSR
jgi:hypothetical protein